MSNLKKIHTVVCSSTEKKDDNAPSITHIIAWKNMEGRRVLEVITVTQQRNGDIGVEIQTLDEIMDSAEHEVTAFVQK